MATANRKSRHLPAFILVALAHGPAHGHAIRATLLQRISGFAVDPGAIYRNLQALEEAGDVTFQWDTTPPGPARKVYSLTPGGWQRLAFWEEEIRLRMDFLKAFQTMLKGARVKQSKARS